MIHLHQPLFRVKSSITQHFPPEVKDPIILEDIGPGRLVPCDVGDVCFMSPVIFNGIQVGMQIVTINHDDADDDCFIEMARYNNFGKPIACSLFSKSQPCDTGFANTKLGSHCKVHYRTQRLTFEIEHHSIHASAMFESSIPVFNKETGETSMEVFGFGNFEFFAEEMGH